ncbi:Snake venom 5'-nucleotidase-like protein [Leptotrombidium deliense]|uniref:5'-nucleotidase n=1 Tax=Leptotrombidium deliense TaxID=299467 RepID=A0A443SGG6_9ACAR|nr:Snake venom 5'-nucleotidase-like protein [Leptotrombidium deliense]
MNFRVYILVHIVLLTISTVCSFDLTILHNNDIHSRMVPTNKHGEDCLDEYDKNCFGGIARLVYKVELLRKQNPNLLYLNAGDTFVGTVWYTLFKWEILAEVVNRMRFDAMSFGNHEFDDGVEGLAPYVNATAKFVPTLACNLDASKEPRLRDLFHKSIIFNIEGRKVAVIGYVTPETAEISAPGPTLKFNDEVESIKIEVKKLKKIGINIFIALGHSGFDIDNKIAENIPDIDIVVGGHTNTFLWNGEQPSNEVPVDEYPAVINHRDGRKTLVVQAFAFSKYLGFLNVSFDKKGNVVNFSGQPILLDYNVPGDAAIKRFLAAKEKILKQKYDTPIGKTNVLLNGECRRYECSMGNFLTDVIVYSVANEARMNGKNGFCKYPAAFMNGGGIRASIDHKKNDGQITLRDVLRVLPWKNEIFALEIPGHILKLVFEHSVSKLHPNTTDLYGAFLQVSGFKVKYDLSKPLGQRVRQLKIRIGKCCLGRQYEHVEDNKYYNVLTTDYLAKGGDLYSMLREIKQINMNMGLLDKVIEFMKQHSPITNHEFVTMNVIVINIIIFYLASTVHLFQLTILHENDIHSRFVPTNKYGEDCWDENDKECFGGIAKLVYKTKHLLHLNAGDTFVGTVWYNEFKWELIALLFKYMELDAMSFGNHEFDDGIEGLAPFINETADAFPTVACNVDVSREPKLKNIVFKSKVFEFNNQKIGVIGYVIPSTAYTSSPGPTVTFNDEIQCIKEEVQELEKQGVEIIIALGHSGFDVDKKIAEEIPEVDIVVGGHSNTFLWTGEKPSDEVPKGDYPFVVNHSDGRKTLVVQAFAHTKYLGYLSVLFDEKGDVYSYSGQPILLNYEVPSDENINELLAYKAEKIREKYDTAIGNTLVTLSNDCRGKECNMGNLVTDSLVCEAIRQKTIDDTIRSTRYTAAFLSGGGIRASIDKDAVQRKITIRNVLRVLPYGNYMVGLTLNGSVLKQAFERSVEQIPGGQEKKYEAREYLQLSGFKVKYDLTKPPGERVNEMKIRTTECVTKCQPNIKPNLKNLLLGKDCIQKYELINESKMYNVLTSDFQAKGGDGYSMLKDLQPEKFSVTLAEATVEYIKKYSPIKTKLEKRSLFCKQRKE